MQPITDVIFRHWQGDVIALFPGDPGTYDPYTCSSYQRIGQHGSADPQGIIGNSRPATPQEYASVKRELESAPYRYRLRVVRRLAAHYVQQRRNQIAASKVA